MVRTNSSKSLPVIIPFVVLSAWSGSVYLKRRRRYVRDAFLQGSMDEIIMDSLQTGDVIGFRHQHWMDLQVRKILPIYQSNWW